MARNRFVRGDAGRPPVDYEIRRFRGEQGIADNKRVPTRLEGIDAADLGSVRPYVDSLAKLTAAGDDFAATATLEVRLSAATIRVELDTSESIDVDAEKRRLTKDLAAAEKELTQTTAKLGNDAFLAKAPEPVVAKIRARQALATEEVARISAKLTELGAS